MDAVQWYLLPLLRWLIDQWDFLLHEERLPGRNAGPDAWTSLRRTIDPPPSLSESAADDWEDKWQAWWQRHALPACREGGLFPDLVIRRAQDRVEFSWGPAGVAGAPDHYRFFASHGFARLDPLMIADTLCKVIDQATSHLLDCHPREPVFKRLRADFLNLANPDHRQRRLGLVSGFAPIEVPSEDRFNELLATLSQVPPSAEPLPPLDTESTDFVVTKTPRICLMFGTLAPDVSAEDVTRIGEIIAEVHGDSDESDILKQRVIARPITTALTQPWDDGYRLADALHESLDDTYRTIPVDIERLYQELGIPIREISLDDQAIRAIAIAGENMRPTVAINLNFKYRDDNTRRFTLAHELCHLLHDRVYGTRLAIASGPWAPVDIEKRANAFAAMFLMPSESIERSVQKGQLQLDSVADIWALASSFGVSFSATFEHLCNQGFVDEVTRDALKLEMYAGPIPPPSG